MTEFGGVPKLDALPCLAHCMPRDFPAALPHGPIEALTERVYAARGCMRAGVPDTRECGMSEKTGLEMRRNAPPIAAEGPRALLFNQRAVDCDALPEA